MAKKTSGLSVSVYFGICFILIFAVSSIIVIAIVHREMRKEALRDAREKTGILLERNLATHHYFSTELKPKIFDKIAGIESEDYFESAWMSSTYAIRQIDKYFNSFDDYGDYYYKECAVNARSPQNEADEYEKAFIKELNNNPGLSIHSEIRKFDGKAYFVTLRRGETMNQSCLRCHSIPANAPADMVAQYGPERSFNRNVGDIVSAVSIRVPLAKAYAVTKSTTVKLSVLLLVILALMSSTLFLFTKLAILRPLKVLKGKSSEISFDPDHLGDQIPLPFGKELGEVVSAFNNMSVKLRDNRDSLEQKIKERTSQLEDLNRQLTVEVDDRKRSETEAHDQKTFLEQVIESLSHPFYVLDAEDYTIKLANSKTNEYNNNPEGTKCYQLSHNRTEPCKGLEHRCTLQEVKRTGQTAILEHVHTDKNGVEKNVEVHGYPVFDSNGKLIQLIEYCFDITERKQAEFALKNAYEQMEERVRERTKELSQTVNVLQDEISQKIETQHALQKSQDNYRQLNIKLENQANQLRQLNRQLTLAEQAERRRLAKILHDHLQQLLVGAKLNIGVLELKLKETSFSDSISQINSLLDNCIDVSRSLTVELCPPVLNEGSFISAIKWLCKRFENQYQLIVSIHSEGKFDNIEQDCRVFIFEIVRELLFNIVKHAKTTTAKIRIKSLDNKNIELVVEDKGVGFDAESRQENKNLEGGFGLFNIRERINVAGGKMNINSKPEKGTQVKLVIPLSSFSRTGTDRFDTRNLPFPSLNNSLGTNENAQAKDGNGKIRVLLAEDHTIVRESLKSLLGREDDIEVVAEASNGKDAVEMASLKQPEIVIMDISMPIMDGIEATRRIKNKYPHINIIALSAHEREDMADAILQAGAESYLTKKNAGDQLVMAIRSRKKQKNPDKT